MHANVSCIACIMGKQKESVSSFSGEKKRTEYLGEVKQILEENAGTHSCPWLLMRIEEAYVRYFGPSKDYTALKKKYNQYMLAKEPLIEERIRRSADPMQVCVKYVCAGNYIDFGPTGQVDDSILERLLAKAEEEAVSVSELKSLTTDLKDARELVYLTDNCGEIVMDKIWIKLLKEQYPGLHITVILRGGPALNDATMEDAKEIGLTEIADCMGNGVQITGTDLSVISEAAGSILRKADVILSKGQGNFEGLYGEKLNPYFLFLCKCELFVRRFGLKKFSSVFAREDHIRLHE